MLNPLPDPLPVRALPEDLHERLNKHLDEIGLGPLSDGTDLGQIRILISVVTDCDIPRDGDDLAALDALAAAWIFLRGTPVSVDVLPGPVPPPPPPPNRDRR